MHFYMKKRLALAAALAFSIIPFATIEEAKADSLKEVVRRLENLKYFHLFNGTFNVECWNQNNVNDGGERYLQIREGKKGGYVVRFRKGKKFYRGDSLEEAKVAFKRQYEKKCM